MYVLNSKVPTSSPFSCPRLGSLNMRKGFEQDEPMILKAIQSELSPLAMEDPNADKADKEFFHTEFISIPKTLGGETFYETKVVR